MTTKIYWLEAITPLHVGMGRGVGFIDLPIIREKVTGWPLVPGSAVKGVIRDHFDQESNEKSGEEKKPLISLSTPPLENQRMIAAAPTQEALSLQMPESYVSPFAAFMAPLPMSRAIWC